MIKNNRCARLIIVGCVCTAGSGRCSPSHAAFSRVQLIEKDLFHEKKLAATERKYIEEKARTQKEHDRQLKMIKRRSREEAQKDLDADTRRIITDNRRMVCGRRHTTHTHARALHSLAGLVLLAVCLQGEELRFQLKTTDELQAAKAETEEENKRLRREVALSAEKETQYARGGHRKTREIRELTAQVQTLEKSLSQVVRDFERERESIEASHKAQVRRAPRCMVCVRGCVSPS